MLRLLPLAASFASRDIGAMIARARRNAICLVFVSILAIAAYASALLGAGLALAQSMGAVQAAFVIAGGQIVVALIIVSAVWAVNTLERRRERERNATRAMAAAASMALLPRLLKSKALVPIAIAAGLAFLAARAASGSED
ncbi:hypothetical protein [Breoghania sp. L-A4]|uniref:hypothetical protein n=1 Tax=Breoghania sp. L-A4 TaxID=2304600 RepID=UPI000E357F5B|nr:hypothetical protein [Breoghania sp. L-A4]AXS40211.1 hypothetical protein D1F64_09260 [Breoghania sp. L-A4]